MVHQAARIGMRGAHDARRNTDSTLQTGLTAACLASPHTTESVSKEVLAYIQKWIPDRRVGILAGSSVHADRGFLVEEMPEVVDWLHYRSVPPARHMTEWTY